MAEGPAAEGAGASARRSLLFSFAEKYSAMLLRLCSMVVLARLLTPADYGAFAAVAAVVGLAAIATDVGIHQYLVQAPTLTEEVRRSAVGLGLAVALVAFGAILGAAALAPEAWLAPELRATVAVLALTLLPQPFAAVANAALQRRLSFAPLYWVGLAGAATLATLSIALAAAGLGPLGLALASVAEVAVATALLLRRERPARPSLRGWRALLGFGWVWTAINGLRQAGDALARLLIGGLLGLPAVGLLSRAQGVVQLFDRALLDAVSPVVTPAVAARRRAGADLAPAYLRQVAYLAAIAWPFFGAVVLLAEPLVLLLLGGTWLGAVPAVRVLAAAGLFLPLAGLVLPYLVALGVLAHYLPVQITVQAGKVALVALGALSSLEWACAGLVAEAAGRAALAQRLLSRHLGHGWRDLGRALALGVPPAVACLAGAAAAALPLEARGAPPWAVLPAAAAAGGLPWLLALLAFRHPLAEEIRRAAALAAARLGRAPRPAPGP